jgi:hypothetical protein
MGKIPTFDRRMTPLLRSLWSLWATSIEVFGLDLNEEEEPVEYGEKGILAANNSIGTRSPAQERAG